MVYPPVRVDSRSDGEVGNVEGSAGLYNLGCSTAPGLENVGCPKLGWATTGSYANGFDLKISLVFSRPPRHLRKNKAKAVRPAIPMTPPTTPVEGRQNVSGRRCESYMRYVG